MRQRVLIGVLSYRAPRYLANLLDNLIAIVPSTQVDYHVCILDQGGGQEIVRILDVAGTRPRHTVLRSAENHGFGGGHNRIFDHAWRCGPFDAYVAVNQDVVFCHGHWLDRLLRPFTDPAIGMAGPELNVAHFASRTVFFSRDELPGPGEIGLVAGSLIAFRAADVARLGLFDEAYFPAYFEDYDIGCRWQACGCQAALTRFPMAHNYLGRVVSGEDAAVPDAQRAEWFRSHREAFFDRWRGGEKLAPADLGRLFPQVYFPPPRPE